MAQKKEGPDSSEKKPGVKIQDLAPSKDAKGGVARGTNAGPSANAGGGSANAMRGQDALRNQNNANTNSANLD